MDAAGNLFIADTGNHRIRKVNLEGIIATIAGDGGPATQAELFSPEGIAVDAAGNLFVAEIGNHRIRKVGADGIITTIAGSGNPGFSGDGGPAVSGEITLPRGVAVDKAGNVFFGEAGNRIRKVSANGIITTVAGTGRSGFSGDGGPGASARIANARGVAVDGSGNLFIADTRNHRIRKVTPNGTITTVVGNGTCCDAGDGGPADAAQLNFPQGVIVDAAGNLFIADLSNRIRKVTPDGIITTFTRNRN